MLDPRDDERLDRDTLTDWVPVSKMFVDKYARPASEDRIVAMIRSGFSADKLGCIMLSMRDDGRFAIIDGNHRVQVSRRMGITLMLARVFIDLTYEQEAELFVAFNSVNRPTALDRFRARLEAGEPQAHEIAEILRKHGMTVAINGRALGAVGAVSALDKLYREQGPTGVYDIVNILHRAWGNAPRAWVTDMVSGMRMFWLRYHDEVDRTLLVERLRVVTPEIVLGHAGVGQIKAPNNGSLVGRQLVETYNRGLRRNRLSEWVERPGVNIDGKSRRFSPDKDDA